MKQNPPTSLVTRASLTATASHNARWFARLVVGGVLGSAVSHAELDNVWNGLVDSNWNTPGNWSLGHVPVKTGTPATSEHGVIDTTPANIATITANITPIPNDIILRGNGRLDHRAGTAATGGGNWMYVGMTGAGSSTYNLANTATPGGGISGYAQGSGTMNVSQRMYVGGAFGGGGTGVMNINTTGTLSMPERLYVGMNDGNGTVNVESGTLSIGNDLAVGSGTGIGVMTVSGGTITTGGWNFIGKNEEGDNSNGTLTMTGGTLTNTGRTYVAQQTCTGLLKLSGGDYRNINNEEFIVAENAGSNGTVTIDNSASELQIGGQLHVGQNAGSIGIVNVSAGTMPVNSDMWLGQNGGSGTLNLSGGTVSVNNWLAIGRANNSTGVLNLSGSGTFSKIGPNAFMLGSDGTGASGTINQTGGTITVNGSLVSLGRAGGSSGTWNFSVGTATLGGELYVGEDGTGALNLSSTASLTVDGGLLNVARNAISTGHLDLNGGTLTVGRIIGGFGADTADFNGTQINAKALEQDFIAGLTTANLEGGGLRINTAGFPIRVPQLLSGAGGVIKSGAGTLTLTGFNTYSGATVVNAGKLSLNTDDSGGGDLTVANGAAVGVTATFYDAQLNVANASFGTGGATTLDINYNGIFGNPFQAPVNVTGTLSIAGTATLNVLNVLPEVGQFPLVKYAGESGGAFVLGPLPPGVGATLVHDVPNKLYYLDINSVALPKWDGTFDNVWSTGTAVGTENWIDLVANQEAFFANGNPVLFDDTLSIVGNSAISLPGTVLPSTVTFNNSLFVDYSISGAGQIGGTASLTKQNTGNLTISTENTYTGVTTLRGGVTTVAALDVSGQPSPLGAATADPANLVFAGGTLNYTGGAVTTNRGYTVGAADNAAVSTLSIASDVVISGQVLKTLGGFVKSGAGTLTYSNPGTNNLANNGFRVAEGNLVFTGATQTNTVNGLFNIGGGVIATLDSATVAVAGGANIGGSAGGTGALNLNGTAIFSTTERILVGTGGAGNSGSITIAGTSKINQTGGWLAVGHEANNIGTLTVKDNGVFNQTGGDFNISDVVDSTGFLILQDAGVINSGNSYWGKNAGTEATVTLSGTSTYNSTASFFVGWGNDATGTNTSTGTVTQTGGTVNHTGGEFMISRDGLAVWNQSAGTVNANGWTILGRDTHGNGTLNISNGTFTQTSLDRPLMVGEFGAGTINITGTAAVNSLGANGLILANEPSGTGTVNLDGGTLTVRRVREGNDNNGGVGGTSTFNFDGGLLKAGANANATFMAGLTSAIVEDGGAKIDSNGQTITIGQNLNNDGTGIGGLTKSGTGRLNLNGENTYLGLTTVSAGSLGGIGSVDSSILVANGASLAPGAPTGAFFADADVDFATGGNLEITISGANGELVVDGDLDITNANLVLTGTPTLPTYVIATYVTKTGAKFANDTAVGAALALLGYSINYSLDGNSIAIVRPPNAFETWISGYFGAETDPAIVGPNADPDGDGSSNSLEFALGGEPDNGSDGPKVYHLTGDSSDPGTATELVMTIAVRNGTPIFGGLPSPTATQEGYTYTVQGSLNLSAFTSAVSVVAPIAPPAPNATPPTGYIYRTFSLDASNGLAPGSKGFLRVNVTP
ncbi:beta strand repeat-containing protein [Luteolibacter sp. Populi]|uniref:beta strand repeat-containing protein n=1 Tax=Luteolibacter sp. Populi TaxID=3230487 RepID=UPI00346739EB